MTHTIPLEWVEKIFGVLLVRYGRDFSSRYEGVDLDAVKADWRQVLGGFFVRPAALRYGLENLPAKPPTATEFQGICIRAPASQMALPAPIGDKSAMHRALAALKPAQPQHMKSWMDKLDQREANGERLNANQIRCRALGRG